MWPADDVGTTSSVIFQINKVVFKYMLLFISDVLHAPVKRTDGLLLLGSIFLWVTIDIDITKKWYVSVIKKKK